MAERDGDNAFWSKVQKEDLPHCGLCDPVGRHVELDDGRIARCPRCHPLQGEQLPQLWRCAACHALIYRIDRDMPCGRHRTVAGWQRDYDQARAGQVPLMPSPVTEAGAKDARTALAGRPRAAAAPGPASPAAGLWGEALAREQLAEIEARRRAELQPMNQGPRDDDDETDETGQAAADDDDAADPGEIPF